MASDGDNPLRVIPYADADAARWDDLAARAPMATFLHTRRYLSYHGERFRDASLLFEAGGALVGLLPAAVDPADERRVVSHPGVTYGGLLHAGALRGERALSALSAARDFYAARGYAALRYKAVPHVYRRCPSDDDLYALFRCGATRYRCDLSAAIDLGQPREASQRRRRGLKKARQCGVAVESGAGYAGELWHVLEENLARRHGVRPVHTAVEIGYLHSLFPSNIEFVVALVGGEVVAGVVLYKTPRVSHAQYIATSPAGQEASALDAVFDHAITKAAEEGARYFDFGSSCEQEGRHLNAGLYNFKSEFGAGGVAHDFYEVDLAGGGIS